MGDNPCGLTGEQIGVEAYNYPLPDRSNLDPNRGSLGMSPLSVAGARTTREERDPTKLDSNPAHNWFSLGDWGSSVPGDDNFCYVPNINPIEQDLGYIPGVPAGPDGGGAMDPVPALNVKYEWTNVRFYNTPASPGTQLVADLTLTQTTGQADGGAGTPCTSQYHVVGLWPAISCEDENHVIDDTLCNAEPSNGRAVGSGISPDLATRCDHDLRLCVLAKEPPSFK
jgi:hypothetical protein